MRVETAQGFVEGIERGGVLQFRGLPYAAPPTGARRWRPPQPPEPWAGVRPADRFGPVASQAPTANPLLRTGPRATSEDCLTLNVFTPGTTGEPRPVMVWIHGGAFTAGAGSDAWYNGTSFARQGLVVVTLNYRLGALGFLHLGDDLPGSGNCGLLDQVAALRWVRQNIAAFGGDPGRVTAFGESAGGMSVGVLMGTPSAAGLFHQAIPQSGAASSVQGLERAEAIAGPMRSRLGGLDGLLTASPESLVDAQGAVTAELAGRPGGLPFQPVLDGVVLRRPPLDMIRAGSATGLRLLTGTTRDEMTLFLAAIPGSFGADDERVARRLERVDPGRGGTMSRAYRALLGPEAAPVDVWQAVETDRVFRIPAIRLAEAAGQHSRDVWMYLFTWQSPALDGLLGSCHALEVPFVWNTLSPEVEGFAGGGPDAERLAASMHEAWGRFAATGDPGWDRYEPRRRATRVFGPGDGVVEDPQSERRLLWDASL